MSTANIEIVSVSVEEVPRPSGKGSYQKASVAYKNSEGKLEAKPLMDFACPKDVWEKITAAKQGDTFSIEREKDAKGYWAWTAVTRQDGMVATPSKAVTKPTYETPDERLQRQIWIVRQSSLSTAVALLGEKAKLDDVLKTASIFVDFVFQKGMEHLEDDPV